MCMSLYKRVSVCITDNGMPDPFLESVATSDPIEKRQKGYTETLHLSALL